MQNLAPLELGEVAVLPPSVLKRSEPTFPVKAVGTAISNRNDDHCAHTCSPAFPEKFSAYICGIPLQFTRAVSHAKF